MYVYCFVQREKDNVQLSNLIIINHAKGNQSRFPRDIRSGFYHKPAFCFEPNIGIYFGHSNWFYGCLSNIVSKFLLFLHWNFLTYAILPVWQIVSLLFSPSKRSPLLCILLWLRSEVSFNERLKTLLTCFFRKLWILAIPKCIKLPFMYILYTHKED